MNSPYPFVSVARWFCPKCDMELEVRMMKGEFTFLHPDFSFSGLDCEFNGKKYQVTIYGFEEIK